jgi:hypothetical protein
MAALRAEANAPIKQAVERRCLSHAGRALKTQVTRSQGAPGALLETHLSRIPLGTKKLGPIPRIVDDLRAGLSRFRRGRAAHTDEGADFVRAEPRAGDEAHRSLLGLARRIGRIIAAERPTIFST